MAIIYYPKVKSNNVYALIGDERHPISANEQFVKFKGRWRLIQRDDLGNPFVEVKAYGITAWFEIKNFESNEQPDTR